MKNYNRERILYETKLLNEMHTTPMSVYVRRTLRKESYNKDYTSFCPIKYWYPNSESGTTPGLRLGY